MQALMQLQDILYTHIYAYAHAGWCHQLTGEFCMDQRSFSVIHTDLCRFFLKTWIKLHRIGVCAATACRKAENTCNGASLAWRCDRSTRSDCYTVKQSGEVDFGAFGGGDWLIVSSFWLDTLVWSVTWTEFDYWPENAPCNCEWV